MSQTVSVIISPEDRARLTAIIGDRNLPLKHVQRARIVLLSGDRLPVLEIARQTGLSRYALGRWTALLLYTGDGRMGTDNNPAERSLRTIALTRKNFLFLGSEAGGKRAADLYTVLETARLNGLNPEAWLADAIDRMAKGHPINRLDELLPWNWKDPPLQLPA